MKVYIDGKQSELTEELVRLLFTRTRLEAVRALPRMRCNAARYNSLVAEVWLSSDYAPPRIRMMGQRKGPSWERFRAEVLRRLERANNHEPIRDNGPRTSGVLGREDLEECILASIE